MSSPAPLSRVPLRDSIVDIVREQIVSGQLSAGAPVRDSNLAEALGASRTPVREALIRLTSEGLLENRVGRGFRVRALRRQDVEEVSPLLWTLEPLALETASACGKRRADQLERITRKMEGRRVDATSRHALDAEWHRCLISGCPNARLLRYIEELRGTLRRYEVAYLEGVEGMEASVQEHRAIAEAYVGDDRATAAQLLQEHWRRGFGELLSIVKEKTKA